MASATICPSLALWLRSKGLSQAYCGVEEHGVGYLLVSFFVVWIVSDFVEFYYHRLGHMTDIGWASHKYHHVFYNPSPFAVIADEYVDQFVRALPLLVFPLVMPTNMDMLFGTYAVFFYAYGVYLHSGHEFQKINAHHPWINTSFHVRELCFN